VGLTPAIDRTAPIRALKTFFRLVALNLLRLTHASLISPDRLLRFGQRRSLSGLMSGGLGARFHEYQVNSIGQLHDMK